MLDSDDYIFRGTMFNESLLVPSESEAQSCRTKLRKYLESNFHVGMSLALVIFSLLLFALIAYILRLRFRRNLVIVWCAAAVLVNTFFLVELILNFVASGPL